MRSSFLGVKCIQNIFTNQVRIQSSQFQLSYLKQSKRVNLYNLNRSYFSTEQTSKESIENSQIDAKNQEQQQYQKPKSKYQMELEKRYPKQKIEQVQAQLKNQKLNLFEYLLSLNNQTSENYLYSSDILIQNQINYKFLKDDPKQVIFLTTLWSGVGYLTTLVHPYLAIIPMILGAGGLFSYIAGRRLVKKTIEKIEFVPNEIEKVRIYLVKGKEPILCRIDQIELVDVNENIEHPYLTDKVFKDTKSMINIQKDISITLNVEDLTGQPFNALNLVIFGNKQLTQVPNYNLLQTVLDGDILRLNKFKVNKKETVPQDFIENMLSEQSTQKILIQKQQQDDQIDEIEQQIQQEVQRFSKKKN